MKRTSLTIISSVFFGAIAPSESTFVRFCRVACGDEDRRSASCAAMRCLRNFFRYSCGAEFVAGQPSEVLEKLRQAGKVSSNQLQAQIFKEIKTSSLMLAALKHSQVIDETRLPFLCNASLRAYVASGLLQSPKDIFSLLKKLEAPNGQQKTHTRLGDLQRAGHTALMSPVCRRVAAFGFVTAHLKDAELLQALEKSDSVR